MLLQETEKFEVERLSKLLGVPFVLTLQPVPAQRYTEIQAAAVKFDKKWQGKGCRPLLSANAHDGCRY
mgnify:CR=1 FL=1